MLNVCLIAAAALAASSGLPLEGPEAEAFLRNAEVVSMEPIGIGITNPHKVTLTDGTRTHYAVWKTIDQYRQGVFRGRAGGFQVSFKDSYKYEVAAYELDKILKLGLVPPTVEREIDGTRGSLQMWVDGAFTELDRREKNLRAPDDRMWSNQMYKLRLLQQLIYNDDAANIRNVIYDETFRVYAIDNSRSFRKFRELYDEAGLRRFSRALLGTLRELDRETLDAKLGGLLMDGEIDALLNRRDLLLETATALAANVGEETVYYP